MVIYDSVTRVGRYTLFFIVGDPVIYLQFIAGEMGRFEAWECGVPDFRANLSYLSQMRWARFFFVATSSGLRLQGRISGSPQVIASTDLRVSQCCFYIIFIIPNSSSRVWGYEIIPTRGRKQLTASANSEVSGHVLAPIWWHISTIITAECPINLHTKLDILHTNIPNIVPGIISIIPVIRHCSPFIIHHYYSWLIVDNAPLLPLAIHYQWKCYHYDRFEYPVFISFVNYLSMNCSSKYNYCCYYPIFKLFTHWLSITVFCINGNVLLLHTVHDITTRFLLNVLIRVILNILRELYYDHISAMKLYTVFFC